LKEIHVKSTSTDEIYAAFTKQRNGYFLGEAEKLLEAMHRDIGKGEANPLVNTSVKMASVARTNGLMKKVFVDASKVKFIDAVRAEGDGIEMFVVEVNKSLFALQLPQFIKELLGNRNGDCDGNCHSNRYRNCYRNCHRNCYRNCYRNCFRNCCGNRYRELLW
jgi:hypothetical protein